MDFNFANLNLQDIQQNLQKIIQTNSLKDLIKRIRTCKTQNEERTMIQKESFQIRNAFKTGTDIYINIEKLLYIHMLGHHSHFGQIECLKLAASPKFVDKKLAYLGTMLLLDENQEVLTLLTNCLKNDLNNSNIYIVGLALSVLGNIASSAMARDLAMEVERLLSSPNSFIRKKACLAAIRIVRKNPDLKENFTKAIDMLSEKNHGVLLACSTLLYELCLENPEFVLQMRAKTSVICRILKTLASGGASPEHDVSGICDPFLQVKLLRLLRVLGSGDSSTSEQMGDVLTLVCTATESSKNVGNSVLYEAVLTILNIESDSSLRVLAINLLGKFLQTNDNNVKYVALVTLTKAAQQPANDGNALQRHRSTILDCLRDGDVTIRKRALELSFHLLNSSNIRILTRELLSYLEVASVDEKAAVASKIVDYAGRYRPNKRWEIDTLIRVLRCSGEYCNQMVVNEFCKCVMFAEDILPYVVTKIYTLLCEESNLRQDKLVLAGLWCMGEFADVLCKGAEIVVEETDSGDGIKTPSEQELFELIVKIIESPFSNVDTVSYGLNCLAKMEVRLLNETVKQFILN
jgi:AP-1 complex subunit gamma-1